MALVRERGADGVSVRGIAGRLGVVPTAVYTYFPDRAAVLEALVDRVLGEVRVPDTGSWRARVTTLACTLRAELLAEPGVVALMAGVPLRGPHALALGEALLDILAEGGLDGSAAARASYALQVYVLGAVALDVADEPGPGAAAPGDGTGGRPSGRARCAPGRAVPPHRGPRSTPSPATSPRSSSGGGSTGSWTG
jgi:AcrR family transcriptional regulator